MMGKNVHFIQHNKCVNSNIIAIAMQPLMQCCVADEVLQMCFFFCIQKVHELIIISYTSRYLLSDEFRC